MQMQFGDSVSVTRDGHVALVTFNRPPHNHISVESARDLADAFAAVDAEADLRCLVLQSEGKNFCAGADLVSREADGGLGSSINPLYDQAVRLFAARTPVIAAVQGAAVGAGLGLVLTADFRVAADTARFSANFVSLGFHPGFGITFTLPRLIGPSRASLMLLTGRRIKPEQALAWGLVEEVVPEAALRTAALQLAREIAEAGPLGVIATRATLRRGLAEAVRAQTAIEVVEQNWLRDTEDHKEGIRAVTERRSGNFKGR
ncbi:MAG: enoyl-CoA hydratase/isomerase family protein [Rhodospirillaceae bacterium]|nr:MAG: enoyl-CoA hydratase/isomerase family protein [Rhodospirillaceae bacterium]